MVTENNTKTTRYKVSYTNTHNNTRNVEIF